MRYVLFICCILHCLSCSLSANSGRVTDIQETTLNETTLIINEEQIESEYECREICGCDRAYMYNETTKECQLNMDYIMKTILMQLSEEKSGYKYEDHDIANDDGMSKRIRSEAQKVFTGIIISVIIFMVCASLCALSACVYCCHINYSDRKLKNDVKALSKRLKRNYNSTKTVRKTRLEPKEESCNVVVGNAGLYVV